MSSIARRSRRSTNIWPGFVDALATLLMVVIFLLMVFVLAQFFLGEALSGRNTALQKLQFQVGELADLLSLERKSNEELSLNVSQLSGELQASVTARDDLSTALQSMSLRAEDAEQEGRRLNMELAQANRTIEADKETIEIKVRELAGLADSVAALKALKEELEKDISKMSSKLEESETAIAEERSISESARAQLALLNRQMAALREQLREISQILETKEKLAAEQNIQITTLGKRLNAALASKVQELSRYRSEFFGRLREVLGAQKGVHIVGDRFVFQSEVLFASGSAELGDEGKKQLARLAQTLLDISRKIPKDIDWILRVDGHTDNVPISTAKFPTNWELSSARAISVVKFLKNRGIPPNRLAAAGFGEHQPLDKRDDEIAHRRNRRIELKFTQR
ncbi:MAG: peptidoglycan -binding protein [Rhodospirillales bacterium]